jgi:DNA-binding Lrp family transcriptional regulator
MDAIDAKIVQLLQKDARMSTSDIGERVGLSASAISRRVAQMERAGHILGYRAVVSPEARGVGFAAYVTVGLNAHTKAAQMAFERAILAAPQVRECHNISGNFEYMLRVEVANLEGYKHFHTEVLGTLPSVVSIVTYVVMDSSKDERA